MAETSMDKMERKAEELAEKEMDEQMKGAPLGVPQDEDLEGKEIVEEETNHEGDLTEMTDKVDETQNQLDRSRGSCPQPDLPIDS